MALRSVLSQSKAAIVERWRQSVLESYPADAYRLFSQTKDRFCNPVGHAIGQGLEALYEGLLEGAGAERLSSALDEIVRIRAVQDFTPSQAVAFVFQLKKAVRSELGSRIAEAPLAGEWEALESRIDELALLAFDVYMQCREKLHEIRANELKQQSFALWERLERTQGAAAPGNGPAREAGAPPARNLKEGNGP